MVDLLQHDVHPSACMADVPRQVVLRSAVDHRFVRVLICLPKHWQMDWTLDRAEATRFDLETAQYVVRCAEGLALAMDKA